MSNPSTNEADIQEPGEPLETSFLQAVIKQYTGLSKDILIYGFSGSLGQLVSLVTLPIVTRMLSVSDVGRMYVIYATVGYFTILMSFHIGSGLWRYYYEVPDQDLEDRQRMVSSLLWFVLGVGIPLTLGLCALGQEISLRLFNTPDYTRAIQLAVLALPVMAIYNLFIGLQRLKRRPVLYLLISLGYSFLYFLLVVAFIGGMKIGIQGIFLAQLIAYGCAALVALWLGRELLAFKFSRFWFVKMAAYGIPLVPASLLNWSLVAINRYYLNAYVGATQVGFYSIASNIALAMTVVVSSFTLAWQPFMFANLKDPDSPRLYSLTLNYFIIITLLIGAGLAVFAREIILIISTPAYLPAVGLVSILVIRQILPGADYITGCGVVISKKTIFTSVALAVGVLVNLLGNLLLTTRLGIYGAAISETCGVLAGVIVAFFISNRLYPVPWKLRVVMLALLGYGVVVLIPVVLQRTELTFGWTILLKGLILVIYSIYLLRLLGSSERKLILGFMKTIRTNLLNQTSYLAQRFR